VIFCPKKYIENKSLYSFYLAAQFKVISVSVVLSSEIFVFVKSQLFFFKITANDRGYGLGRAAGEFLVAIATKEMRAQRLPEAH
jgi:hypothetical protein